jgi:hypothetical protein
MKNLLTRVGPVGFQHVAIGVNGGQLQTTNGDAVPASAVPFAPFVPATWNPVPADVATALDELALERAEFVFQPSGTAAGNVFTSWAALYAAALATPGPKTIYFDSQFTGVGGVCTIPAGTYDFGRGCVFQGLLPGTTATANRVDIVCPNGVVFTTPIEEVRHARLTYSGSGTLMTIPATPAGVIWHFSLYDYSRLNSTGSGTFFDVPANTNFLFTLYDSAVLNVPTAGGLYVNVSGNTAGTGFTLAVNNTGSVNGVIPINCFAGPVGPGYAFAATRLSLFTLGTQVPPLAQQNGMPGGVITVQFNFDAPRISYTPAVPAQWVAPAPTTVKAALDRIAAVVSVGGATPIP